MVDKKKDSPKVDFDFSDITTSKDRVAKKISKKQNKVTGADDTKVGLLLSIPTKDPKEWISKDIAECNGTEFLAWAEGVYPIPNKISAKELNILKNRISIFKQILKDHKNTPMFSKNGTTQILN